ncbi:hypothetical protein TWF730_000097 [Orbilia blumenaviensis]|uniref:F-box domain-containing protein n=1 Tax=Orbilia blumenaviensis TaxID=1796055 RepID=A0AAV9VLN4_9PEZI
MTSPFLNIPLEIRNQIYEYLTLFHISPVSNPTNGADYLAKLGALSLDLSVLRVNRQIHDEASSVLYSQNTFPIKIRITGCDLGVGESASIGWSDHFTVRYQTLWEDAQYYYIIGKGACFYTDIHPKSLPPVTRIAGGRIPQIPSPQYRHLIRSIKLAIYDMRLISDSYDPMPNDGINDPHISPTEESCGWRMSVMSVLIPFVQGRLRGIFSHGDTPQLEIHMRPGLLDPARYPDILSKTLVKGREDALGSVASVLKELVYIVWPLTRLPGGFKLEFAHPEAKRLKDITAKALRECNEGHEFNNEQEEELGAIQLPGSCAWAVLRGKLIVVPS